VPRRRWPTHQPLLDSLRTHTATGHATSMRPAGVPDAGEQELLEHRLIRQAVLEAQRQALVELRRRGAWTITRDLELEALRLDS